MSGRDRRDVGVVQPLEEFPPSLNIDPFVMTADHYPDRVEWLEDECQA